MTDRSQFNRRSRYLWRLLEELRRFWLAELGLLLAQEFIVDTKTIPVLGYKKIRAKVNLPGSVSMESVPVEI